MEVRIPVAADGLTLRETSDSHLLWQSDNGRHVAAAPAPVMLSAHPGVRLNKPLDYYVASSKGTWADIFHVVPGWY